MYDIVLSRRAFRGLLGRLSVTLPPAVVELIIFVSALLLIFLHLSWMPVQREYFKQGKIEQFRHILEEGSGPGIVNFSVLISSSGSTFLLRTFEPLFPSQLNFLAICARFVSL